MNLRYHRSFRDGNWKGYCLNQNTEVFCAQSPPLPSETAAQDWLRRHEAECTSDGDGVGIITAAPEPEPPTEPTPDPEPEPDPAPDGWEARVASYRQQVDRCKAELEHQTRRLAAELAALHADGRSYGDIAKAVGLKKTQVTHLVSRAPEGTTHDHDRRADRKRRRADAHRDDPAVGGQPEQAPADDP